MAVTLISKADKEELVEHYLTHIYDFAQDFLPHFLMNKTPEFHKEIYELLTTESFLSLSAPRGFAKSTVCSIIFPIWAGLFKWKGDITLVSASEDFVVREITSKIRNEFENNKRLIKVFGDLKTPQWSASYFKLKNGIAYEAVGINGQLRGGRRGVIVLDDIENIESVLSEEQRTKIKDRINKELIPKLLPDSTCVFIGTIIHPLCYLNQVLKTEKNGWTKREYRAYRDTKATDAAGQRGGNELWPEMWNHKSLQARKAAIGSSAFACFTGETAVKTPNGDREISKLIVGDEVFDKDKGVVTVKAVGSRFVDQIYNVWLYGYDKPLRCSDNHQFLVWKPKFYRNRFFNHNSSQPVTGNGNLVTLDLNNDPEWVQAKDLVGNEFCLYPTDHSTNESNPEYWWTVGRYLAEGYVHQNCVGICCNKQEKHKLERTLDYLETTPWRGRDGRRRIHDCGSTYSIYIGSKDFSERLSRFGRHCGVKRLTKEAMCLDKESFMSLLDGYLSGDGYVAHGKRMANSIDRGLLLDFKECLAKFGIPSYLNKVKDHHYEFIIRKIYGCQPLYHLTVDEMDGRARKVYFRDGLQYSRIRRINVEHANTEVFDIKTDGNFLVDGAIVHNSEYLNDPVSDGSQPIKDSNIKYWENLPEKLSYYICLDPAYREETKSDFKVAVVVGVDGQNNRYLVEYIRTHDPLGTYIDSCLDLYGRYKANCVKFAVPGGREIDFYNRIKDQANQSGVYPPFDEVKYIIRDAQTNRGMRDKHSRIIRSLQPLFEAGKYYIHANHKEAYEELLTFANGSLHDDVVDAMSGCEQFIQPLFSYEQVEADAVNAQFWKEYQAQGDEEQGLQFSNMIDTDSSKSPGDSGYGDY